METSNARLVTRPTVPTFSELGTSFSGLLRYLNDFVVVGSIYILLHTYLVCNQELGPLISDIERSVLALVSAYYSLPSTQGRTLRKLLSESMVSLANSMQCLLRALDSKPEGQR